MLNCIRRHSSSLLTANTLFVVLLSNSLLLFDCRLAASAASGRLRVTVVDRDTGKPIACRMHLVGPNRKPQRAKRAPFWHDHFALDGEIDLRLPLGQYTFEMERGLEYHTRSGHFTIEPFADDIKEIDMPRFVDMSDHGWWSGDLHVRRPVHEMQAIMKADDLHIAQVVTWWNDKHDWYDRPAADELLVCFNENRYYHVMAGGHTQAGTTLLYFHLPEPMKLKAAMSGGARKRVEFPPLIDYATGARTNDRTWIDLSKPFWWDLPMLVAAGQVDSIQVAHDHLRRQSVVNSEGEGKPRDRVLFPPPRGNARWSQEIYFRLLECGLRMPPSAGSGSGKSPNPVGYNRVYVHVDGSLDYWKWWENFRAGQVVITNGPLLRPTVEGKLPGHVFRAKQGEEMELLVGLTLSTREKISYLELIKNGQVEHSIRFEDYANSGQLPKMRFDRSGWFLIRAVTDNTKTYRFAMTGPYFVEIGDQPRISKKAAQFFLDWVYERARQIKLDDAKQHAHVLSFHRNAREFWQDILDKANAE